MTLLRGKWKWIPIALIVIGIAYYFWDQASVIRGHIQFVTHVSGLKLPSNAKYIDAFGNRETYILVKWKIPVDAEMQLLQDNTFECPPPFKRLNVMEMDLPESMKRLPDADRNCGFQGRIKTNKWEILYDKKNKELWCLVEYPDMAGDDP